ncbi:uncharacterized protein MKZ38_006231 [Zalerion maritima]|uniref:Uncharacterized protein n=1 Tax=Zalerion maritima TaxID=339359 RepID=A0AAD5RXK2_9PEZI|nr:uncharacterized protein MKZ38_006231 [Zalerion maritima]
MMREVTRKELIYPPPSPSPQSLHALEQQGRRSRNGPRDRIPLGVDLQLDPVEDGQNPDITSPEQSVTSSARFHWPKRRGPGSVTSSVTSASSTGRSHRQRTVGKSLDDYIHSLDAATSKNRQKSRHNSRERSGRDRSRTRGSSRASSQDRGRSISRGWTPKPKRSPTSPVPMSPEDLISLTTPRVFDGRAGGAGGPDSVVSVEHEPSTVRKSSSVVRHKPISSRASSRTRRKSPDRRPPALEIRDKGEIQERSVVRSPSSPAMIAVTTPHFQGSEDEEDYRRALEDQERFRTRHNRSTSRGLKEPTSPILARRRERSQSRNRSTAALEAAEEGSRKISVSSETRKPHNDRQVKKELAARELEERRQSLARRPSAPPIPHPETLSPAVYRSPMSFDNYQPPTELPTRSQTVQPVATRGMQATRDHRPPMGLPATPKAMRLKFETEMRSAPNVPPLPRSISNQGQHSPTTKQEPPSKDSRSGGSGGSVGSGGSGGSGGEAGGAPNLMTLLPSTVYTPPTRNPIQRCMSAPIPDEPPRGGSSLSRRKSTRKQSQGENNMKSINERRTDHGRRPSYDDQLPPPPPPPPAPPVLRELQHLAVPPPPPPAPIPGVAGDKPQVYGTSKGVIEIVMDEDDQGQQNRQSRYSQQPQKPHQIVIPAAAPLNEQVVPIISPPAPPSARGEGHRRGRSGTDNSLVGRISRATERMRSSSRTRNNASAASRTLSPDFPAPYESVPPPMQYTGPPIQREHPIERHPRDVKAGHTQEEFRTGLLESEMI